MNLFPAACRGVVYFKRFKMQHPIQYIEDYNTASQNKAIQSLYQTLPGLKSMNLPSRVAAVSAAFLGKPYVGAPAGEGHEGHFDQSPLYRFDVFDCVTLLNMVLALALSYDVVSFRKNLLRVGYRGAQLGYQYRHHFMSVDWNVHNTKIGLTEDITESIMDEHGKSISLYAQAIIDRPNWFKYRGYEDIKLLKKISAKKAEKLLQALQVLSERVTCETSNMPYLPLTKLFDKKAHPNLYIFDQIPQSSIIEIVRPNWNLRNKVGTNMNVSHVGFAIRKNNQLLYRQASSIEKRVMDIPLTEYLKYRLESPTIKGIHVQRLMLSA